LFNPSNGSSQCFQCNPGSITSVPGLTSCTVCTGGRYSSDYGASLCSPCLTGTISALNASSCLSCEAGRFTANKLQCQNCGLNKFSNALKSSSCSLCVGGTFSSITNATSCQVCSIGKFSYSGVSCQDCPKGTYAQTIGSSSCILCPDGLDTPRSGSVSSQDCSICLDGYFGQPPSVQCQKCPALGVQFASCDSKDAYPYLVAGYFRTSATTALACVPPEACLQSGNDATTSCSEGYAQLYCGACAANYYRLNSKCSPCPSKIFQTITVIGICLIGLALGYRLTHTTTSLPLDAKLVIQTLQMLSIYPEITTKWPAPVLQLFSLLSLSVSITLSVRHS
jgi:hypothetical protein